MKHIFWILLLAISCSNADRSEIKSTYDQFNRLVANHQMIQAMDIMDSTSLNYFEDVARLVNQGRENEIMTYCNQLKAPFATRFLIQQGEIMRKKEKGQVNALQMSQLSNRLGMGIFLASKEATAIKYIDATVRDENNANVSVSQPMDSMTNVVSNFPLRKENEVWKIDVPASFKLQDKILRAKWKASGKTARKFVAAYIDAGDYTLENVKYKN